MISHNNKKHSASLRSAGAQETESAGTCLVCEASIETLMSFGRMPIANGFLTPDQFEKEYFFELSLGFCPECSMVQLIKRVDTERLFHQDYAYFSSISRRMASHFKAFADSVKKDYLQSDDPFVVEIGSNDGILLRHISQAGIRHLGVDPAANVARAAEEKGVRTLCRFFNKDLAKEIVAQNGQADLLLAANVMCHIPDIHPVIDGIRILLKPGGIFAFEDPYLGDIIEKTSYDQIYDEHVFYFSLSSISHLFEKHAMEIIHIIPQNVHGGSMRYFIAEKGTRAVSEAVIAQRQKEASAGLTQSETFDTFRKNIERSREQLISILHDIGGRGKRIVGYGATSKSTTVTNYCGITPGQVEFISDTTPGKQGKYSPGAHIPVLPYENFVANYPDYALLFAWNHMEEIFEKEREFSALGGKWVVYVPEVRILS